MTSVDIVEVLTRGQRLNNLWYEYRKNRLTSTKCAKILARKKPLTIDIVNKIMYECKNLSHIPSIAYGIEYEKRALDLYTEETGYFWRECGLFISKRFNFLCASPDAVVVDSCIDCNNKRVVKDSNRILEVKCLYSLRGENLLERLNDIPFIDKMGRLRENHIYFYQIYVAMFCSEKYSCDLILYANDRIHVQTLFFDWEKWAGMQSRLIDVYTTYLNCVGSYKTE